MPERLYHNGKCIAWLYTSSTAFSNLREQTGSIPSRTCCLYTLRRLPNNCFEIICIGTLRPADDIAVLVDFLGARGNINSLWQKLMQIETARLRSRPNERMKIIAARSLSNVLGSVSIVDDALAEISDT